MRRRIPKFIRLLAVLAAGVIVVSLIFPTKPPPPLESLPDPNGYDTLVQAGRLSTSDVYASYDGMAREQLLAVVNANSNALHLARTGLQQECRVPLQVSRLAMSKHVADDLNGFKKLAQALEAESRLAELESRRGDAAISALDIIRLGNEAARGGLFIDQLLGVAIESKGAKSLERLAAGQDAKTCREIAETLETLHRRRDAWNDILERERNWSSRFSIVVRNPLVRFVTSALNRPLEQRVEEKYDQQTAKTRRLMMDFAARAHQLDRIKKPESEAIHQ